MIGSISFVLGFDQSNLGSEKGCRCRFRTAGFNTPEYWTPCDVRYRAEDWLPYLRKGACRDGCHAVKFKIRNSWMTLKNLQMVIVVFVNDDIENHIILQCKNRTLIKLQRQTNRQTM